MGSLIINHGFVTDENANKIVSLCPFGAISYDNEKLDISSACKMCKLCVKKSDGIITYEEEVNKVNDNKVEEPVIIQKIDILDDEPIARRIVEKPEFVDDQSSYLKLQALYESVI